MNKAWDVFISHASEDKTTFVRPLAIALQHLGVKVWYDEFSLRLGDSLSQSVDRGLVDSQYALVVLSPAFIGKQWPAYELRGLVNRELGEDIVVIPIWHGVTQRDVSNFSPSLADKMAIVTLGLSAEDLAIRVLRRIRPDLYERHPRGELERLATGEATQQLQHEIERVRDELTNTKQELSQFQCPYCGAPVTTQTFGSADLESLFEGFACGYEAVDGSVHRICPSDPRFPALSDFELLTRPNEHESLWKWSCTALPKTPMARHLPLLHELGETEAQAKEAVAESYRRASEKWTR